MMMADLQTGLLLLREGNYTEVEKICEALIEKDSENFDALYLLGVLALHSDDPNLAIKFMSKAMSVDSTDSQFYFNRGNILKSLNRLEAAVESYSRALELKPDCIFLPDTLLAARLKICDWKGLNEVLENYKADVESFKKVVPPLSVLSLLDAPEFHKKFTEIYTSVEFPEDKTLGRIKRDTWNEKIRLGYFSADFRNHAVAFLIAGLIESHDRDKFEVCAFSYIPDSEDVMGARLSSAFDHFIDVSGKSDEEVTLLARELKIDIAINLGGHTKGARTGIFAKRCAPLQVNFTGYPGTMGATYIDYIIADKIIIPEDEKKNFTEKIVYLPDSYLPFDDKQRISEKPFERDDWGLPESGFIFCCFNSHFKILPAVFDVWMKILGSVAGSVLWLRGDNPAAEKNLRKEAGIRGVDGERLIFAGFTARDEHLARHRLADLFLDTVPYNAHATTVDALFTGLPVLTCKGKSFASRVAASLLISARLPELITETLTQYEAVAIDLALNPGKSESLREKLNKSLATSSLFNTQKYTQNIEEAYKEMDRRRRIGLQPKDVYIT